MTAEGAVFHRRDHCTYNNTERLTICDLEKLVANCKFNNDLNMIILENTFSIIHENTFGITNKYSDTKKNTFGKKQEVQKEKTTIIRKGKISFKNFKSWLFLKV